MQRDQKPIGTNGWAAGTVSPTCGRPSVRQRQLLFQKRSFRGPRDLQSTLAVGVARPFLFDDAVDGMVEGQARRGDAELHPFTPAALEQFDGTVMAVGIVADIAEQDRCGPMATSVAILAIVAGGAESAELFDADVAREAERLRSLPDVDQLVVPDVAADEFFRRQRRTPFDVSIGLDAQG